MYQRAGSSFLHCTLLVAILALGLDVPSVSAEQPIGAITQGGLVGTKWEKIRKGMKPGPYHWTLVFGFPVENSEDIPSGGLATFGLFESGEIALINHAEYTPTLSSISLSRDLYPAKQIFDKTDLPRFLMTCAWPQEEGQPPASMIYAFAERDDANFKIEDKGGYLFLTARWSQVPMKRVQSKFSAQDYCGEISNTNKSSAPLWLPATKY